MSVIRWSISAWLGIMSGNIPSVQVEANTGLVRSEEYLGNNLLTLGHIHRVKYFSFT